MKWKQLFRNTKALNPFSAVSLAMTLGIGYFVCNRISTNEVAKESFNEVYCALSFPNSIDEERSLNLAVILEEELEAEKTKIEASLEKVKHFYKKEFNIAITYAPFQTLPEVPEYENAENLPIPPAVKDANAFLYLAKELESLVIDGELRAGGNYGAKIIVTQDIGLLKEGELVNLIAHEIAHLYYVHHHDNHPTYSCLMSDEVMDICSELRAEIMHYRNRKW